MTITANLHPTRFFFLNHGETDWDRDGRLAGRINAPLNGRGLAQARRAGELLQNVGVRTICTSPQDRALMTAEIVAAHIHVPVVTIDGLKDCCFGGLDGARTGAWLEAWRRGATPEGGESAKAFLRRALRAMNQALSLDGPVLIVAHPGIYAAFQHAAGMEEETLPSAASRFGATPILNVPPYRHHAGWSTAHLAA